METGTTTIHTMLKKLKQKKKAEIRIDVKSNFENLSHANPRRKTKLHTLNLMAMDWL